METLLWGFLGTSDGSYATAAVTTNNEGFFMATAANDGSSGNLLGFSLPVVLENVIGGEKTVG